MNRIWRRLGTTLLCALPVCALAALALLVWPPRSSAVRTLAYSADGKALVVAHGGRISGFLWKSSDSVVSVLDAADFRSEIARHQIDSFAGGFVALKPSGFIAFGTWVEFNGAYNSRAFACYGLWSDVGRAPFPGATWGETGGLAAFALSPDSALIAKAADSRYLDLHSYPGREPNRLILVEGWTAARPWRTPDRESDATDDAHGRMPLTPGRSPHGPHGPVKDMPADVYCVTFSPDSRYLVSGGYDRKARVWDVTNKKLTPAPVHELGGHAAPVTSVQFVAGGDLLSVDAAGRAVVRRFPSGEVVAQADLAATPDTDTPVGKHRAVVAPGGKSFALLDGRTVRVYSTDLRLEWRVPLTRQRPSCVAFSPNGKRLAVGFDAGGVEEFDTETQRLTQARTF